MTSSRSSSFISTISRSLGYLAKGLAALICTAGLVLSVAATGSSASIAAGLGPGNDSAVPEEEEAILLALTDPPPLSETPSASGPMPAGRWSDAFASEAVLTAPAGSALPGRPVSWTVQADAAPKGGVAVANDPVPVLKARIVRRYPHDPGAFTQGLIWRDGTLYESVGQPGRSEVRRVRLEDGRVLARAPIPADQFGEGLAAYDDQLVSLTWQHGVAYRWDPRTLRRVGQSRYPGEGWGLASDGRELALSDGTPTLRFLDPASFAERRRVTVTLRGRPLRDLNELEWIDGALYGNVWHTPYLVRIDPASGAVTALVDLSAAVAEIGATDPEAVANGIAWDAKRRRLFVTGKYWPALFEVTLGSR